jgi:hypothetical protein
MIFHNPLPARGDLRSIESKRGNRINFGVRCRCLMRGMKRSSSNKAVLPQIACSTRDPRVYAITECSFLASSARASSSSMVCLALPDGRLKIRCLNPILRSRWAKSSDGGKPITANSSESKHRPRRSQRARSFPSPQSDHSVRRAGQLASSRRSNPGRAQSIVGFSIQKESSDPAFGSALARTRGVQSRRTRREPSNISSPDLAHCQHPFAQDFPTLLV